MVLTEIERASYIAAHRVLAANTSAPELACAGARRSHAIDIIAGIIKDTFELLKTASEAEAPICGHAPNGRSGGRPRRVSATPVELVRRVARG